MLFSDRKRAFSWTLLLSLLFCLGLYINGVSILLDESINDALIIFEYACQLAFAGPLLPLIAALPFAASFCRDVSSGYIVAVAQRAGKTRCVLSKVLSVALSGGAAVSGGMFLFILTLNLRYPPDFGGVSPYFPPYDMGELLTRGGLWNYAMYYGALLFLQFLGGSFWALTALCFSSFYPDYSLTLCAPLVVYRLIHELGRHIPAHWNPISLETGYVLLPPLPAMLWGVSILGGLSALLAAVFCWRAKRRLSYA